MKIRAKFMLTSHTHEGYGHNAHGHTFEFQPQYDPTIPEDQRFAKATLTGKMTIRVDNPAVIEHLAPRVGRQFFFDVTQASDDAA